jgi:hypothetical protein
VIYSKKAVSANKTVILFSDLPQGIYLLNVVCDGKVIARKIVKQ